MSLDVAGFAAVATVLTLAPGQDTFLTLRNSSASGFRSGAETALGICCGLFGHATLSAVGLSALLVASAALFGALKLAGVLYLFWLAIESFSAARVAYVNRDLPIPETRDAHAASSWHAFRQGLMSNVLNPKTAGFYLALLPQYVRSPESALADSLVLASVHFVIAVVWLFLISAMVALARPLILSPRVQAGLHSSSGLILCGFAGALATEPNGEP